MQQFSSSGGLALKVTAAKQCARACSPAWSRKLATHPAMVSAGAHRPRVGAAALSQPELANPERSCLADGGCGRKMGVEPAADHDRGGGEPPRWAAALPAPPPKEWEGLRAWRAKGVDRRRGWSVAGSGGQGSGGGSPCQSVSPPGWADWAEQPALADSLVGCAVQVGPGLVGALRSQCAGGLVSGDLKGRCLRSYPRYDPAVSPTACDSRD
jgi:hypothetical protein